MIRDVDAPHKPIRRLSGENLSGDDGKQLLTRPSLSSPDCLFNPTATKLSLEIGNKRTVSEERKEEDPPSSQPAEGASGHDKGYDSESTEATEVTSNTGAQGQHLQQQPPEPGNAAPRRGSSAKDERWSSGGPVLGTRWNAMSTRTTEHSSSTNMTASAKKSETNTRAPKRPDRRRCRSADLPQMPRRGRDGCRSKPRFIDLSNDADLEQDFEKLEGEDDDQDLSASSATSCSFHSPYITLTEDRVRAHLRDYYEDFDSIFRLGKSSRACWESFFAQYFTPDIQWIRSSSNSLTGPELAEHFAHDIVGIRMKLVSINSIQILAAGLSAVVTFTADQKFEYRGTPNSDRTVITMVLQVANGREIRIAHEHRCTGIPIPADASWD